MDKIYIIRIKFYSWNYIFYYLWYIIFDNNIRKLSITICFDYNNKIKYIILLLSIISNNNWLSLFKYYNIIIIIELRLSYYFISSIII